MRRRDEGGETLVELLIAIVIMGLVVGAVFATYATAATAAKSQRDFVKGDAELRDYAEALQAAARSCTPGAPLVPAAPATPYPYPLLRTNPSHPVCPPVGPPADAVEPIEITVTPPNGAPPQKLTIYVRTP